MNSMKIVAPSPEKSIRCALSALFVFPCLVFAQQHSARSAVLEAERRGCLAYETRNLSGIRAFLTDDYTLTDGKGVVTTKQDDLDDFAQDRIRYTIFKNANMKARLYGKTAVVIGQTHVVGSTKGSPFDVTVQFTDTLVFMRGEWRLAAGHVSRLPSTAAPSTAK